MKYTSFHQFQKDLVSKYIQNNLEFLLDSLITTSLRFVTGSKLFHLDQSNNACCRLLIFWCVVTTLSSVISIYYAIDAQNRLYEATENVAMIKLNGNGENDMMENNNNNVIMEPRYHHIVHRFAPYFKRANVARRSKHRKHSHKHSKSKNTLNKKSSNNNAKMLKKILK